MQASDWIALIALIVSFGTALLPRFAAWRRKKRSGLRALHVGMIELGFSGSGNTVALEGNFRSHDDDFFVHALEVSVTRSDGECRHFSWLGVRPRRVVASLQPTPPTVLGPTGFELKNRRSQYYYIVFSDVETAAKVSELLAAIRAELTEAMQQAKIVPYQDPQSQTKVQEFESSFLNQLYANDRFEPIASSIRALCFWQEGRYGLKLRIKTTAPEREFTEKWHFSVTAAEAKALVHNATVLMFQNLGQMYARLNFPEVPYDESQPTW